MKPAIELRFHHLGLAVRNMQSAIDAYARMFACEVLWGPVDDPVQKVTVCFVGSADSGGPTYELVAPLAGAGASPVDRIAGRGNTGYHVCYEVPDLDRALVHFKSEGCVIIGEKAPAAAFGGRRIAWLLTATHHLLELVEGEVARRSSTAG